MCKERLVIEGTKYYFLPGMTRATLGVVYKVTLATLAGEVKQLP